MTDERAMERARELYAAACDENGCGGDFIRKGHDNLWVKPGLRAIVAALQSADSAETEMIQPGDPRHPCPICGGRSKAMHMRACGPVPASKAYVAPEALAAAEARGEQRAQERAREAFLNMIADTRRFDEEVDGDCDGNGRPTMSVDYYIETGSSQLAELCETIGIKPKRYAETLKDAILALLEPAAADAKGAEA